MGQLQPIDGPYYLSAWFWGTTALIVAVFVVVGFTRRRCERKHPWHD